MLLRNFAAFFLMLLVSGGVISVALAGSEASDKDVSVRKLGVAWNIAEDRKMENTAGIYGPEGLDKYMKRYFDQLSLKLDQLSAKVDKLSTQIAAMKAPAAKKETANESSQARIV